MMLSPRLTLVILLLATTGLATGPGFAQANPLEVAGNLLKVWQSLTPPVTDWRFHAGTPADSAPPAANASGWEQVKGRHSFPGRGAAGWYTTTLTVPGKVAGFPVAPGDVVLSVNIEGFGDTFVNGRHVQAFEDELGTARIATGAKPGDILEVAVKVRGRGKEAGLRSAKVSYRSLQPLWRKLGGFMGSLQLLYEVGTKQQKPAWVGAAVTAISKLDQQALAQGNTQALLASLDAAGKTLAPIDQELKKSTIFLIGQSHIDLAWEWPWHETVDVCKRTFGTALDIMDEYPGMVYSQSQAAMYQWMEERYPDLFARIKRAIAQGRWEIVGGMWTEPDCNIPNGESFVRQLLMGKRYFLDKFGVDVKIGWVPDSFGYNLGLPQILAKAGMTEFAPAKLRWNEDTRFPYQFFWWQGPDGSKVLCYMPEFDELEGVPETLMPYGMLVNFEKDTGANCVGLPFGVGDHGGGPTREMVEMMEMMKAAPAFPRAEYAPTSAFFSQAARTAREIPVWKDELYLETHRGVQTTMAEAKKNNRRAEQGLHDAELFSLWATTRGLPYPAAQLNRAWKLTLTNQMHDILPGSAWAEAYDEAMEDWAEARHIALDARNHAVRELAAAVDTNGPGVPVFIFNPLPWVRNDVVEVDLSGRLAPDTPVTAQGPDGRVVPCQWIRDEAGPRLLIAAQSVPAFGYALYRVVPGTAQPAAGMTARPDRIDSRLYTLEIDPGTGTVTRIFDKQGKRELLAPGGIFLEAFKDTPRSNDAWNIDADYANNPIPLEPGAKVTVLEQGPVRSVVRVTKALGKSTINTDVTLYNNLPRIDFRNDVDWQEEHVLLKAGVSAALDPGKATYEVPYAVIERTTKPQTPQERAKFEVPAQQWADLSAGGWGLSLLNDCKYGYDIKDNRMRLSLLRSPLSREDPPVAIDKGRHTFTWSLYPHPGDWRQGTMRAARALNDPLFALVARNRHTSLPPALPPTASFLQVEPDNILVEAVKMAEDGQGWIIRWQEIAGQATTARITLPAAPRAVVETDLIERGDKPVTVTENTIEVPTGAWELKTVRVKM